MTRIKNRQRGVAGRHTYRPRGAEPTSLLLAPRVESFVHPHHVTSSLEAEALSTQRWLKLWKAWRPTQDVPVGLRVIWRDREAYEVKIAAHSATQVAEATP